MGAKRAESEPAAGALASRRVLLVDDDAAALHALAESLTRLGCRVAAAPSAARALEYLRGASFDAVCSDIDMPEQSGLALARAIRAAESRAGAPPMPLLAITGLTGDEQEARLRRAGFDACLAKPIDVALLVRRLRALIAGDAGDG